MSNDESGTHRLTLQVQDGEGESPDVDVTIDGDGIDGTRTTHSDDGSVTFQLPSGSYEIVDVEPPGYEIDDETPSRFTVENGDETDLLMLSLDE
ncbi:SpaA isopeptide-forming pilin-related protein [Halalkalicoccus tibetensis]|uniref:SpaA isopeptide-forming pilin-related protein n=1 Tax=Halalkalicoccus tibetensis TaxID=175632 RepID=A0ABD5V1X9_9EURY